MLAQGDPRKLRLYDVGPSDILTVQCSCGRLARFAAGELQRRHRVPSDTLLHDLQYRLRCGFEQCRRTRGIRIVLWDGEPSGPRVSPYDLAPHVVIVEGEMPQRVRV